MELSIREMVTNPSGKGTGFLAARKTIKAALNASFLNLLQNFRNKFYAIPYVFDDGRIWFLVKVPSEFYNTNKILYDCVVEIPAIGAPTLSNRPAKFFTNSPSFVYTYAYVFNKDNLLIQDLKDKYENITLTQPPETRNPVETLGFEKILYICCSYLINGQCLSSSYINRYKVKMTVLEEMRFKSRITPCTNIERIYNFSKSLQVKKPKKIIDQSTRAERLKEKDQYSKFQKVIQPKPKLFKRAPRGKLSYKSEKRRLEK